MNYAKIEDGLRVSFIAEKNGALATGIAGVDFVATVVAPDLLSTATATVAETAKAGLYSFLIPSAFLTTHGPGVYSGAVEVDSVSPKVRSVLAFNFSVGYDDHDTNWLLTQGVLASR